MLPTITKSDNATFERHVQNVIDAWCALTPDQIARGRNWYATAQELAFIIGSGDVRMGAAVIAALSPQKSWEVNVTLAHDAQAGNVHGQTGDSLDKVRRILSGERPEDVLPMDKKTGNFFRNIADPDGAEDAEAVTIDRHAARVIDPDDSDADKGLGCAGRYAYAAHVYREASRRIGEIPAVVQAGTWIGRIDSARWVRK